jgi:hypothetical protein
LSVDLLKVNTADIAARDEGSQGAPDRREMIKRWISKVPLKSGLEMLNGLRGQGLEPRTIYVGIARTGVGGGPYRWRAWLKP